MRKLVCLFLSLAMLLTLAVPAFAEDSAAQPQTDTTTPQAPAPCTHNWVVESTTNATCTAAGSTSSKCSLCGATKTEPIPSPGHSLGTIVHKDESCHKRTCSVCGYEETSAHTLTETPTTPATCTTAGVSTFSCPCGYSFTQEMPMTAHTFTAWTATVEIHSRSCTGCSKSESGAHAFSEHVEQAPTCKEPGVIADYCPTCEYIVYEEIPKLTTHTYDNACDSECNVCGLTREIEHKYQQWRTKGAIGHWYACSICGDKGSFEKHYPGPAATEEKDQICLTCGYVMTPKKNHQHDYAKDWTTNEEGHWYACSGCEDQKDFAGHEYEDSCDADCNVCGYLTGNAHSFDGNWHSDEDGHWFVCSACGQVAESRDHSIPADAKDTEDIFCAECGYLISSAMAHVHEFAEQWHSNTQAHWRECECGEKSENTVHTWNEGSTGEDGTITYQCTVCEAQYTEAAEETIPEESGGFPWWIVLAALVILLVAAIIALILILKPKNKGRFSR